jgi:threonine/homoserine/homoserine lactone efflux protein
MSLQSSCITIFFVHLLAVASPGPGFLIATRNSLHYGVRAGIATALGITLGDFILLITAVLGTSAILIAYPKAMILLQVLGASYLIYIGCKSILSFMNSRKLRKETESSLSAEQTDANILIFKALNSGFITTILNPKAIIYFLSLTSQIIKPEGGLLRNILVASILIFITFFWFSFVALAMGNKKVRSYVFDKQGLIDGILGLLLISLGFFIINSLFDKVSSYMEFL